MSNSTPVKNRLIPVVVQMMSAWFVYDGCYFVKFLKWCLIPCVLPQGSDVFVDVRFKIQGWGYTGPHVGSARCFGSSIGTLVTRDADVARQPAELNVEV